MTNLNTRIRVESLTYLLLLLGTLLFSLTSCQKDNFEDLAISVANESQKEREDVGSAVYEDVSTFYFKSLEALIEARSREKTTLLAPTGLSCGYSRRHNTRDGFNDLNAINNVCYNGQSSFNGSDLHFMLNIPSTQEVTISLTDVTADVDLFVFTVDNQGFPSQCKGFSIKSGSSNEFVTAVLSVGTYLISVDGYRSDIAGAFTLSVDCDFGSQACCEASDLDQWLPTVLQTNRCPDANVKCCEFNGRSVIDIDLTPCGFNVGFLYTCNGDLLQTYGGFAGTPKPNLSNCKDIDTSNSGGCNLPGIPENCTKIECTPQSLPTGRFNIQLQNNSEHTVKEWKINGNTINQTPGAIGLTDLNDIVVNDVSQGTYEICCYFVCGNTVFECCREVQCYPNPSNCILTEDDFQDYTTTRRIAQQAPQKWRTWSPNGAGTVQDAYIYRTSTGKDLLYVVDENLNVQQDVIRKLGNKTTGKYEITMDMWVRGDKSAYYNLQMSENNLQSGGYWGIKFETNGTAKIIAGGNTYYTFHYPQNDWFEIDMILDLDADKVQFSINNGSTKALAYNGNLAMGGINFYAINQAEFWVNNFLVKDSYCSGSNGNSSNLNKSNSSTETVQNLNTTQRIKGEYHSLDASEKMAVSYLNLTSAPK